jgi:DNA-binding transcriptional ArsR family regulator
LSINMVELRDLFVSKTRVKLLEVFFSSPRKIFYVRELVRLTGEQINAVRRELTRLKKAGLLSKEQRGNRLYYGLRKDYPLYDELLAMIGKTSGIGGDILANQRKIGKIKYAMLSKRFLKWLPKEEKEIDFLIVGQVILPQIASLVRAEEARRKREVNYTVMTLEEFDFRKRRRDPFIMRILSGSRVMLIGQEEDLVKGL